MQAVSNEFKELAKSNARISLAKFIIKDSNTEIDGETIIDGFIEEPTCDDTSLVGNVMAKNLETSIYNNFTNDFIGKEIYAYTGQQLEDETEEYVPRGTFIIDEIEEDISSGALKLKGLDYTIKFNKAWEDPLDWENNTYTLGDFAKAVCEFCDLELETEEFSNSDYVLTQQPAFEGYQCRYVMQRIAEIATSNVFISPEDKVQIRLAPQNYVSAEGSSITLEESANSRLKIDEFDGEITQKTTTGKNLLKPQSLSQTLNGITVSYESKTQTYTFNGTCTTNNTLFQIGANDIEFVQNTTQASAYWVGGSVTNYCSMRHFDNAWGTNCNYSLLELSQSNPKAHKMATQTFTCPQGRSTIRFDNGSVANNFKVRFMVANSDDYVHEPYTNGPSPNPEYPQNVEITTGRQEVDIISKNLLDLRNGIATGSNSGITATKQSDYTYTFVGTATSSTPNIWLLGSYATYNNYTDYLILDKTKILFSLQPGTYTIKDIGIFYIYEDNTKGNVIATIGNKSTFTLTKIAHIVAVRTPVMVNGTTYDTIIYPQIESGSNSTDYEPYKSKYHEINLGKNLFDINNISSSYIINNGFKLTKGTNRTIQFNLPNSIPAGTYTLSVKLVNSTLSSNSKFMVNFNGSGSTILGNVGILNNPTFTITSPVDNLYFFIASSESDGVTITIDDVMLEKGDKATSFSPYFEPIFLGKINTYKDFIRRGKGVNLFDNTKSPTIGSDTIISTGKKITHTGSTTTNAIFEIYAIMDLTNYVGKTVRFDADFVESASNKGRFYIGLCDSTGNNRTQLAVKRTRTSDVASFVVPELTGTQTYLCLVLYANYGGTVQNGNYVNYTNMILTIDNEDMTYEPYGFKDKWYLYKKIEKINITSSMTWYKSTTTLVDKYYTRVGNWDATLNRFSYCNRFIYKNGGVNIGEFDYSQNGNYLALFFCYASYNTSTINDFKSWLDSNEVYCYVPVTIPIIIEITNDNYPELLSQLKAIEKARSMEGITYIDVDSVNLPFDLSLQYDQKVSEDIDINSIISLEVEDTSYKPYNAVTLALADGIEGENVTLRDETSIALYGERALVITANEFAINQAVREELIEEMFNSINGFNYVPMKLEYNSYDWLERYDRIKVQYDDDNYYETYLFNHTTEFPSTIKSVIEDVAISENKVKYEFVPETQQKNVHTEIVVDKLNGTISEVVSTQEEFEDSLSQLTITVDGIQSKVELNYDFVRETSGNNYVSVDDIQQEGLLELKITGTAISEGYLRLHITNNVPEYIELPISTILKQGNIADELSIENIYNEETELYELHCFIDKKLDYINNQIVTHSSSNNYLLANDSNSLRTESGEELLLEDYVEGKQDLGIISIPIQEGQHTFSIENFNNLSYYLKYAVLNNITSEFALKKHIVSEINQSAEQIQISADKVSLTGKTIELTSDNININSDNFKVDEEGNMICNNANVNGVINSTNGNVGGWQITDEGLINDSVKIMNNGGATIYTMADLAIVILHIQGTITLSGELLKHYDLNDDGIVDLRDMVLLQNILKINVQ